MSAQFDFKKEWEKTKKQLLEFSKEATKMAKKGEEELVKFSKKSMDHIDATAANLKKEKLYYRIGKEYIATVEKKDKGTQELDKLVAEYKATVKAEKELQKKIKAEAKKTAKKKKPAAKKTAKKKASAETPAEKPSAE